MSRQVTNNLLTNIGSWQNSLVLYQRNNGQHELGDTRRDSFLYPLSIALRHTVKSTAELTPKEDFDLTSLSSLYLTGNFISVAEKSSKEEQTVATSYVRDAARLFAHQANLISVRIRALLPKEKTECPNCQLETHRRSVLGYKRACTLYAKCIEGLDAPDHPAQPEELKIDDSAAVWLEAYDVLVQMMNAYISLLEIRTKAHATDYASQTKSHLAATALSNQVQRLAEWRKYFPWISPFRVESQGWFSPLRALCVFLFKRP